MMKSFLITIMIFVSVALIGSGQRQPTYQPFTGDSIAVTNQVPAFCTTLEQRVVLEQMDKDLKELNRSQMRNDKKLDSMKVHIDVNEAVKALDNIYPNEYD